MIAAGLMTGRELGIGWGRGLLGMGLIVGLLAGGALASVRGASISPQEARDLLVAEYKASLAAAEQEMEEVREDYRAQSEPLKQAMRKAKAKSVGFEPDRRAQGKKELQRLERQLDELKEQSRQRYARPKERHEQVEAWCERLKEARTCEQLHALLGEYFDQVAWEVGKLGVIPDASISQRLGPLAFIGSTLKSGPRSFLATGWEVGKMVDNERHDLGLCRVVGTRTITLYFQSRTLYVVEPLRVEVAAAAGQETPLPE